MSPVRNFLILERKTNISNRLNSQGVTLILVLFFILTVVVLANIALVFMVSHTRFTHHQVSRIQGFYAAQAGMNYALEMLRVNDPDWPPTGIYTHDLRRGGVPPDINEPDLPVSVQFVHITVWDVGSGINGTRRIDATAHYD